jgi:hypothetical protein
VDILGKILHLQPSPRGIGFVHLMAGDPNSELRTENPLERILVLVIWAACCYFIQALFEKQKRAVPQTPA